MILANPSTDEDFIGDESLSKSFVFCSVQHFNENEFMVPIQEVMLQIEGDTEAEGKAEIMISPANQLLLDKFDIYDCKHDYKVKVFGKVFNKPFNYYFITKHFNLFYSKGDKLAIIALKTDIALDYINALNQNGPYKMKPIEIDFKYIAPRITEMSGVWISGLNKKHVKTKGLFGDNVNKSEEFLEASQEGKVSSVQIKFVSSSREEYSIGISKRGSITLYDKFALIEDELGVVKEVYDQLLKKPAI